MRKRTSLLLAFSLACSCSSLVQILPASAATEQKAVETAGIDYIYQVYHDVFSDPAALITTNTSKISLDYQQISENTLSVQVQGTLAYQGSSTSVNIHINELPKYGLRGVALNGQSITSTIMSDSMDVPLDPALGYNAIQLLYGPKVPTGGESQLVPVNISIDTTQMVLSGYSQPKVSTIANEGGKSVTFSVPQDSGTGFQWQIRDAVCTDGALTYVQGDYVPIEGATSASYTSTGFDTNSGGGLVRCAITTPFGQMYSMPAMMPLDNSFPGEISELKVELSTLQSVLSSYSTPQGQHLALFEKLNYYPKYFDKSIQPTSSTYSLYFAMEETAAGQSVETAVSARPPVDLNKLNQIGSYQVYAYCMTNGVYSMAVQPLKLEVVADGTTGNPSLPELGDPGYSQVFEDVPAGQWFTSFVEQASELGLMKGTSQSKFSPFSNIKRGDLALILYRLALEPDYTATTSFKDVNSSQYYYNAIEWAASQEIITGYTTGPNAGNFMPELNVSRQDLVTMLGRYAANMEGINIAQNDANLAAYPDSGQVASYAAIPFGWAVENQIINGKEINNTFYLSPASTATRAEAAKMLVSFNNVLAEK